MLISCPACGAKISVEAKSCIHCGHPIKSGRNFSNLLPVAVLLMFLVAGLGAVFQLNPDLQWQDFVSTSSNAGESVAMPSKPPAKLSQSELRKELQAYSIRLNRLTPYKPNPMLTLQRVYVDYKPVSVSFDYEMVDSYDDSLLRTGNVRSILMARYCEDEEFALFRVNHVPLSFRYLRKGRLVHTERIDRCELG